MTKDEALRLAQQAGFGDAMAHLHAPAFKRFADLVHDAAQPTGWVGSGWVGLTDDEILAIGKELGVKCRLGGNQNIDFDYARAIEAKLKEKNT